ASLTTPGSPPPETTGPKTSPSFVKSLPHPHPMIDSPNLTLPSLANALMLRCTVLERKRVVAYICCLLAVSGGTMPAGGRDSSAKGEWRFYGGDRGNTKYSPLDQINAGNVNTLKVAWTWASPDLKIMEQNQKLFTLGFEATPLMVGGTLYLSTSLSQVAA